MWWPDYSGMEPRAPGVYCDRGSCSLPFRKLFTLQQPGDSFMRGRTRGPARSPLPHLCAGGPSMIMLTHRICMALRGLGRLHTVDRVMRLRAAMLLLGTGDRQPVSACSRHSTQRVGRKVCLCLRAQLETDKVLDVVEDTLAFLNCIPRRETRVCVSKRSH